MRYIATVFLLVTLVGCNANQQRLSRPVTLTADQQVLADREAVLATPADPQAEQNAQEWARLAADREHQQNEDALRLREQRAREAQDRAFRAQQRKMTETYTEQAERQQKLNEVREVGYQLQNLGNQVLYLGQQIQVRRQHRQH
jgi:uncharacterized lipoprotein NlpE involved in copper resistance